MSCGAFRRELHQLMDDGGHTVCRRVRMTHLPYRTLLETGPSVDLIAFELLGSELVKEESGGRREVGAEFTPAFRV